MKRIICLLLLAVPCVMMAQTGTNPRQSNLVWEYTTFTNQDSTYSKPGKIISYNDQRVEWIQNETNDNPFVTRSISGTWSDVSQNGSLVFNISMGESTGTIEFKRTGDEILVILNMNNPGRKNAYIKFFIDVITPL